MSRFALVTLLIFVCLSGCSKKTETTIWLESRSETEESHTERIEMLKERLEASMLEADRQYGEYEKFILRLLNDGVEQGKYIVCCWSRSLLLREVKPPEPVEAVKLLQQLVKDQKYIEFSASYTIACPKFGCDLYLFLNVMILDDPYGDRVYNFGKQKNDNWQYRSKCEKRFRATIPNGAEARNNERRTYASITISSIKRLKRYQAKIPVLEDIASKALAAGVVLAKLRHDIEIDVLDPSTAEDKIREYQEFLNRAAQDLDGARREMATDPEVTNKEVDDVLKQM